jgi:hypothetical protein
LIAGGGGLLLVVMLLVVLYCCKKAVARNNADAVVYTMDHAMLMKGQLDTEYIESNAQFSSTDMGGGELESGVIND